MRFGVLAACLALPSAIGEQSYKYGGVDATGERLGVMPTDTGVDFSEPNEGYCDGCLSTLEAFHMQWLQYVSKESNEGDDVDQKAAGSSPPAITYNDEVEDTVNDICKSKSYREYGLSDQTTEVCQSMIGTEAVKRKIVAQFLAKDLGAKNLPVRKREACGVGGLVEACQPDEEARAFDVGGTSKCELCTAVVQDALYEARRHKHKSGPWKPQSIFDALDNLCPWCAATSSLFCQAFRCFKSTHLPLVDARCVAENRCLKRFNAGACCVMARSGWMLSTRSAMR